MENKVKGTRFDVGNDSGYRGYCGNSGQYNSYRYQYHTVH